MKNQKIEIPRLNDKDIFEDLVTAIWKNREGFNKVQRYARSGQNQSGIDIYAQRDNGTWVGIQCKVRKNGIKKTDVIKDINNAKNFKPELSEFTIATTAERDGRFQDELTKLDSLTSEFDVNVIFWDDIEGFLKTDSFLNVYRDFYPQFFSDKCQAKLEPYIELIDFISAKGRLFPTVEEFHNGNVVSNHRLKFVLDQLHSNDRVLIWGNSATGKTVLAISAAMTYYREGLFPIYYDFQSDTQKAALLAGIDYLDDNAKNDTIVIFDNCQLSEDLTLYYGKLRRIQENRGYKSIFITRTGPNYISDETKFLNFYDRFVSDYGVAIRLVPDIQDFNTIVQLFARRGRVISSEHKSINTKLCDRFGRDLFVFSYLIFFTPDPVQLDVLDPSVFQDSNPIDTNYLELFSNQPPLLEAFVKIAAFSALGLLVDEKNFTRVTEYQRLFSGEVAEGLINRSRKGYLSIEHPSLGSMITKRHAEVKKIKAIDYIADLITSSKYLPKHFFVIIAEQKYFNYKQIIKALYREPQKSKALLHLGIILPSKFWDTISSEFGKKYNRLLYNNIDATIEALPVSDLTTTINIVSQILMRTPEMIGKALEVLVRKKGEVWAIVSHTSPHIVSNFLTQLFDLSEDITTPEPTCKLASRIVDDVVFRIGNKDDEYFGTLTRSSISLGYVTSLLKFLKPRYSETHDSIAEVLFIPSYCNTLVGRGLSKQLDQFAKFIEYSEKEIKVPREDYVPYLLSKSFLAKNTDAIRISSLNSIVYYLRFWQSCTCEKCSSYINSFFDQILAPPCKQILIMKLSNEHLPSMVAFLEVIFNYKEESATEIIAALCNNNFLTTIQKREKGLPPNTVNVAIERLSLLGVAGKHLSDMIMELSVFTRAQQNNFITKSSDIREIVLYLKTLYDKGDFIIEENLFKDLSKEKFFENWLYNSLTAPWRQHRQVKNLIDSGLIIRMTFVFKYMHQRAPNILSNLLSICHSNKRSMVNVLTSDYIDMVSLFLSTLQLLGIKGKKLHQELVISLSQDSVVEKLCQNSFKKDVSYLKSFLAYSRKNAPNLNAKVMFILFGSQKNALFDACAHSTPHQLVSFLKYVDKFCSTSKMNSKEIIHAFEGHRLETFRKAFYNADETKRGSLTKYLEKMNVKFDF